MKRLQPGSLLLLLLAAAVTLAATPFASAQPLDDATDMSQDHAVILAGTANRQLVNYDWQSDGGVRFQQPSGLTPRETLASRVPDRARQPGFVPRTPTVWLSLPLWLKDRALRL